MNVAKSGVSRSDSGAESGHLPFPGALQCFWIYHICALKTTTQTENEHSELNALHRLVSERIFLSKVLMDNPCQYRMPITHDTQKMLLTSVKTITAKTTFVTVYLHMMHHMNCKILIFNHWISLPSITQVCYFKLTLLTLVELLQLLQTSWRKAAYAFSRESSSLCSISAAHTTFLHWVVWVSRQAQQV